MRKCLLIMMWALLSGCVSENQEIHVNTEEYLPKGNIEMYQPTTLSKESVIDGLNKEAYVIDDEFEHTFKSHILEESDSYSISFWIQPTDHPIDDFIFVYKDAQGQFIRLANSLDNGVSGLNVWFETKEGGEWLVADPAYTLKMDEYNHVVFTMDQGNVSLYLNGENIVNSTFTKSTTMLKEATFSLGKDSIYDYHHFKGSFQDFEIYNHSLSVEEIHTLFMECYPEVLLNRIQFEQMEDVIDPFWLYPEIDATYPATWSSNHPEFIDIKSNRSVINIPTLQQGNQEVTLTISCVINDQEFHKDFKFIVRCESSETALYRDTKILNGRMNSLLSENTSLPTNLQNGTKVKWKVINGLAMIKDNLLIKTSENEKTPIQLEATLSHQEKIQIINYETILLDEYQGYVMMYFNGELEHEQGRMAYSHDGLHWTDLKGFTLSSELGSQRVRDPFINRDKEGNFMILATQGYDHPEIYSWQSTDLITFNYHDLHKVAYYIPSINSTGKRAWAPEFTYDKESGLYYVYYSDPENHGSIYYVTTSDFKNYSYPKTFFGPGYSVIDGTIVQMDGAYYMFYKDEREGAKTIYYTRSQDLSEGFHVAYDENFLFSKKYVEGPFVLKSLKSDTHYLYVDNYYNEVFYVGEFNHLNAEQPIRWLTKDEYYLPNEDVRHGSVIEVTQKEIDKIIEAYQ